MRLGNRTYRVLVGSSAVGKPHLPGSGGLITENPQSGHTTVTLFHPMMASCRSILQDNGQCGLPPH